VSGVRVWTVSLGHGPKAERRRRASEALRAVLTREAGPGFQLVEGPNGKPALAGERLQFNLSHSGNRAAIAVCEAGPVGVDIEAPRTISEPARLARRICTERELEAVRQGDDLLRLWVRKEAVAKASGEGLSDVLARIEVLDDLVGSWRLAEFAPGAEGYLGAVAFPAGAGPVAVRSFDSDFGR
jgi:4'-phosphopantetheinyl transferase